ncbi:hypothetical protein CVIRNUC_001425 [Coccomyxa viridis]|uniref:Protease Do-like PDZ domain-containing protein n=1 Tax=Coccomyxa viridis TaxID=1274662 RepID=A0AAV1HUH3_9CHLO|nr:hypothetical protein CVIRNUC_001425 [Coccomyxa viridis]
MADVLSHSALLARAQSSQGTSCSYTPVRCSVHYSKQASAHLPSRSAVLLRAIQCQAGVSGRKKPPSTLAKSKKKSKTPEGTVQGAELNGAGRRLSKVIEQDVLVEDFSLDDIELDDNDDGDYAAAGETFMNAVVKVLCVHSKPNFSLPWQRKRQFTSTSSGFMVRSEDGQRWLLTNAHSVEYHAQVKVKRRADDQKFLAQVLAVGTDCDIALLTVEDEAFWEGVTPLELGPLPTLQDAVAVVGYPIGGETISVTTGVVSRIEVTSYSHGATELLGIQIDAAINPGNSGGPCFNEIGQCVGIAFQSLSHGEADGIGYVIPTPVINHFLTDYRRNGRFTGFPVLGVKWQRMESAGLRSAYGLDPPRKGVLVRSIWPTSPVSKEVKPDDIIMRFDGVDIACDGTVPFRRGERIAFSYLISQKYTGESAQLDILRGGEELSITVPLDRPHPLVPIHLDDKQPSYLVIAGIIFTVCCEPYLDSEYGDAFINDSPVRLMDLTLHGHREFIEQEIVVLSQVLACDATLGYEEIHNTQVLHFNSTRIRNLAHLAQLTTACTQPFMRFDLDLDEVVVLDTKTALKATEEILAMHSIPSVVSKDLAHAVEAARSNIAASAAAIPTAA